MIWLVRVNLGGVFATQTMISVRARSCREDLLVLHDLVEAGTLTP